VGVRHVRPGRLLYCLAGLFVIPAGAGIGHSPFGLSLRAISNNRCAPPDRIPVNRRDAIYTLAALMPASPARCSPDHGAGLADVFSFERCDLLLVLVTAHGYLRRMSPPWLLELLQRCFRPSRRNRAVMDRLVLVMIVLVGRARACIAGAVGTGTDHRQLAGERLSLTS